MTDANSLDTARGEALEEAVVVNNSAVFQEHFDAPGESDQEAVDRYEKVVSGYRPEMGMLLTLVNGIQEIRGDMASII